jgi:hypothetical protein
MSHACQKSAFCMLLTHAVIFVQEDSVATTSLMSGMANSCKGHAVVVSYLNPPLYCHFKLSLIFNSSHFTSCSSYLNNSQRHVVEKNCL